MSSQETKVITFEKEQIIKNFSTDELIVEIANRKGTSLEKAIYDILKEKFD